MLFPLRPIELSKLIPAVATGNQFKAALGNPRKILQRILISSIGGVITLLISSFGPIFMSKKHFLSKYFKETYSELDQAVD